MNNVRMVYSTSTLNGSSKKTTTRILDVSAKTKGEWKITKVLDHSECHELFVNGVSIRTKWLPRKYSNTNRAIVPGHIDYLRAVYNLDKDENHTSE